MKDIKEFIQDKYDECDRRSTIWENQIKECTEQMKSAETDEDIQTLKFRRQECLGNMNGLTAVKDFCNKLLTNYFGD